MRYCASWRTPPDNPRGVLPFFGVNFVGSSFMFSRAASRLRLGLEPRSRSLALAGTCCLVQSSVRLSVRVVSYKWQVFAFRTTLQFHYYFVSLFSPSFSLFFQGPRCSVGSRNNRPNTYPSVGLLHRPGGGELFLWRLDPWHHQPFLTVGIVA